MEKPLLKISFKETITVRQHDLSAKANYIVEKKFRTVSGFIVIGNIFYPLDLIKSIEFIQPNEL